MFIPETDKKDIQRDYTIWSHKINTALAQAYYAKEQGIERLVTETGAGQ